MKTRQFHVVRTLAIACAVGVVVTGGWGTLKTGTAGTLTAATISRSATMYRTTAVSTCAGVEQFRSARCNDERHMAGGWNANVSRNQQRGAERMCVAVTDFRSASCNDIRHFGS